MSGSFLCTVCGHWGPADTYIVKESMLGLGDPFTYFQCSACGCLQIAAVPRDLSRYYPRNYYSFSSSSREVTGNPLMRAFRRIRNRSAVIDNGVLGRMFRTLAPNPKLAMLLPLGLGLGSRILDVGCGSGWRLYAMREAGFHHLLGVDPFLEQEIRYANGLRIEKKSIHDVAGEWDVVMFHHSFEHASDPHETLHSAFRLLRPGGTCLIRIPTVSSRVWEQYREHWYQIDAPRHFFLHSRESMEMTARRSGFAVTGIVCDATIDQFRRSEASARNVPPSSLSDRKELRGWERETIRLNREGRGDQAAFYLVKKSGEEVPSAECKP